MGVFWGKLLSISVGSFVIAAVKELRACAVVAGGPLFFLRNWALSGDKLLRIGGGSLVFAVVKRAQGVCYGRRWTPFFMRTLIPGTPFLAQSSNLTKKKQCST